MSKAIQTALVEAMYDGQIVSGLVRRARNGQFSKFNGKISQVVRQTKTGEFYLALQNFRSGHWQTVKLNNFLMLKKGGQTFKA